APAIARSVPTRRSSDLSDKPDTRFGMEIQNISETVGGVDFAVFKSALEAGGSVRAIVVENGAGVYTRKEIDKLTEHAKGIGAQGDRKSTRLNSSHVSIS